MGSPSLHVCGDPGPLRPLLWLERSVPVSGQPELTWESKFSTWTHVNNKANILPVFCGGRS